MTGFLSRVYHVKWLIIGILLVTIMAWVAFPFLDVFVYGIFIYYITRPIKKKLSPHFKSESLLVLVCLFLVVLPLIIVIAYTLIVGISQLNQYIADSGIAEALPDVPLVNLSMMAPWEGGFSLKNLTLENITQITNQEWYKVAMGSTGPLLGLQELALATGSTIVDIIFKLILIMSVAFYLLRDDDKLIKWIKEQFPKTVGEHDNLLIDYTRAVDKDLEKIFFGNILSIVFFAFVAAATFYLINTFAPVPELMVPSPILMGILAGISAFIPVVGMWLVLGPLMIYIAAASFLSGVLIPNIGFFILSVAAIVIFVEVLPDYVIRPFIARGQVHTGLLMFAYIFGPIVFGISGLFLGAILLVLITNYFKIALPRISAPVQQAD